MQISILKSPTVSQQDNPWNLIGIIRAINWQAKEIFPIVSIMNAEKKKKTIEEYQGHSLVFLLWSWWKNSISSRKRERFSIDIFNESFLYWTSDFFSRKWKMCSRLSRLIKKVFLFLNEEKKSAIKYRMKSRFSSPPPFLFFLPVTKNKQHVCQQYSAYEISTWWSATLEAMWLFITIHWKIVERILQFKHASRLLFAFTSQCSCRLSLKRTNISI